MYCRAADDLPQTLDAEEETMRRFRNPVYAIESLERKLSPTDLIPVAAYVSVPTGPTSPPTPPTIPPGNGDPPTDTTTTPSGPAMPA